jgi:hypothetical protein
LLSGKKSVLGVKVKLEPVVVQLPGVFGASTGRGETFDNGADNETVIGAPGPTAVAPSAGVTEAMLSGDANAVVVVDEDALEPGVVVLEVVDPTPDPPLAEGAVCVMARLTRAPVTPPAAKTRTTVPITNSGDRRGRTWLLAN